MIGRGLVSKIFEAAADSDSEAKDICIYYQIMVRQVCKLTEC
jgi:hypothetical protein